MEGSDVDRVLRLAEPIAGEYGLEVLAVELKGVPPRRLLRVFLDSPMPGRAVTLDDCTAVSRRLGDVLEAHEALAGSYLLEVSSPGVNRPLRTAEQFGRAVGQRVRARFRKPLDGVQGVLARLTAVEGERLYRTRRHERTGVRAGMRNTGTTNDIARGESAERSWMKRHVGCEPTR